MLRRNGLNSERPTEFTYCLFSLTHSTGKQIIKRKGIKNLKQAWKIATNDAEIVQALHLLLLAYPGI